MIPFRAFGREPEGLADTVESAIAEVLQSTEYVRGEKLREFESAFSAYADTKHAIGVNSGADALTLSLQALDITDGDEVIVPSHTYIATANAVVNAGGTPIFADVNEDTYCLDVASVEERITERTAGIIPVHLYGHPAPMTALCQLSDKNDLFLLEDAAQAHGATIAETVVGSLGDAGCFSFFPGKNLSACGNGGMVVTDDDELASTVREFRQQGFVGEPHHTRIGTNSVLDEIQAAVLLERLPHLVEWNRRRREAATRYQELLAETPVVTPTEERVAEHVYHLYVIRSTERESLATHLESKGIETGIHYPNAVHEDRAYRERGVDVKLPVTERITSRVLSLPMHPWVRSEEIETVCRTIQEFYE